jgi:biotin transport system substrate-specific component
MYGDENRSLTISRTATFIALIAVGGWISIPFFPVPLTLQTLFVYLAGAIMRRRAWMPAVLYIVLGALNLPVFHNGLAGIGILLGPTGGYLIGFVFAALIVGFSYERNSGPARVAGICAGAAVIYLCGVGWLVLSTGLGPVQSVVLGCLIFLPGEAVKMAAAYAIASRVGDDDPGGAERLNSLSGRRDLYAGILLAGCGAATGVYAFLMPHQVVPAAWIAFFGLILVAAAGLILALGALRTRRDRKGW